MCLNINILEKYWKTHWKNIIGIALSLTLVVIFLSSLSLVSTLLGDIFRRNTVLNDNPLLILFVIFFFGIFSYLTSQVIIAGYYFYNKIRKTKKTPNWWVWGTILLMVFVFCSGMIVIDNLAGNQDLNWVLRDRNHNLIIVGEINCTNGYVALLEKTSVRCMMNPDLINRSGMVRFYFTGGQSVDKDFSDLSFIAPSDVHYVYFEINGLDRNNTPQNLSVGNSYHFDTPKEYEDSRKLFSTYLFGLFVLVMFSVPAAVVNFRKLNEKK